MSSEPRYMAKLTDRARRALNMAAQQAMALGRRTIAAELLLTALLMEELSAAAVVLEAEGVDRERLRHSLTILFAAKVPKSEGEATPNRRLRRALDASYEAAKALGNPYIGTEHLLLGVMRNLGKAGQRALAEHAVTLDAVEERIRALGAQRLDQGTPDRWNELLKAELAEKLKEIDLDASPEERVTDSRVGASVLGLPGYATYEAPVTPMRRVSPPAGGTRWEYRAMGLGAEAAAPETLARQIEETLNRQIALGWEYVHLAIGQGRKGMSAVLVIRRRV